MLIEEKLRTWENYIRDSFSDIRSSQQLINSNISGPEITKEEVIYAIKLAKSGKAVGPDEISGDILKLLAEENIHIVVRLFNGDAASIDHHHSLMSHVLKIFLKVIHNRIYRKVEENISNTQFGFRNGFGTRDALFGYQVLLQRCWDMNRPVYICFIDYEKAFDRVQQTTQKSLLKFLTAWALIQRI
ncbi:unnamed protein product [Euphydryas editha]|uniref:Reverse transcriptase domain-containing protein n=1 Tax=Euphydryas editha TaxID=104508 RepID=A0AAU9TU36_EUPED|nr:unnamed protein product [Euphydryas editha]